MLGLERSTVQILKPAERHAVELIQHPGVVYFSVLVGAAFRRQGTSRELAEAVFECLPPGLEVEAWVLHRNEVSLAVMPRLGFVPDRILEHDGHKIQVFVRRT